MQFIRQKHIRLVQNVGIQTFPSHGMPPPPLTLPEDRKQFIKKLMVWATHASREDFQNRFSILSMAFGDEVTWVCSLPLTQLLEDEIVQKRKELAVGIEDYGLWRASRNNPNFAVYVDARRGESAEISQLTQVVKHVTSLEKLAKELVEQFGSVEALAEACSANRSIAQAMITQPWKKHTSLSASLSTDDIALCLAWDGVNVHPASLEHAKNLIQGNLSNYDACRLLSARAAEQATISYYKGLGHTVEDVSIGQLSSKDNRWKDFDLLADELAIDVKNARHSYSSPETYVEHCVPKFKLNRQSGSDVSIVGVLSDYLTDPGEIIVGESRYQILGQVNISEIRQLYRWMRIRFGMILNLDGIWNAGFLPGWIFEYTEKQYAARNDMIPKAAELLDLFHQAKFRTVSDLPEWLLALCPSHPIIESLPLPNTQKAILEDLASLEKSIGLKRSSLYIYAMGFLLESMLSQEDFAEAADTLSRTIFVNPEKTIPLGLIDTQDHIANLVRMLIQVCEEARRQKFRFTAFHMPHPAILRGLYANGRWMTLIAYCGGWLEEPFRVKCGASPLFFGEHEVCLSCGRLVCHSCGFCSEGCDLYLERKNISLESRFAPYYGHFEDEAPER